jgi:alkyldihydroxyacetonephosphate synthase
MSLAHDFERALPAIDRSESPVDAIAYARDLWPRHHLAVRAGRLPSTRPGLVVWPRTTEEVAAIVRFASREGVPIVPYGAGSGVCAGILPDARTIVIDLKRLERWRALDPSEPSLEVEAGAMGIRLEEELAGKGYTLGHFPSSILCSTVGGWVAARSAGQCSGMYGKIEDMVAALEWVAGDGEVVRFERRTRGPDLTPLLIGSEGVLGIVTAAKLRLHPAPTARAFGAFSFPSIEAGWTAMRAMFQRGLRPAVSRLYDPFDSFIAKMGSVRRARGGPEKEKRPHGPGAGGAVLRSVLRAPAVLNNVVERLGHRVLRGSTLVLIFEGERAVVDDDLARATSITQELGATSLGEGPAQHWLRHRYSVSYRQAPVFMAGAFSDTMEVAAPWSKLGALYEGVRKALGAHVFVMAHLSHAYPDGCSIYFTFAGSAANDAAAEVKYDAAWRAALDAAIAAGGTLSHHHGVGRSKAPKLGAELGLGVDIVHALRGALDPAGVMNPGNLVPRESPKRRPVTPPPKAPTVDRESLLVHVSGDTTLTELTRALAVHGLSLGLGSGLPRPDFTVAHWIADGASGAPDPWEDPVDHFVAGFTATLTNESGAALELEVRPAPRRAVGPDLYALFHGMEEKVGVITSAWLRVRPETHHTNAPRPLTTSLPRNLPMTSGESAWIERVASAVRRVK